MDAWATAADLAAIYRTPKGTIYRWASEDRWRRTRTRPTRYHAGDADTSYHKRHTGPPVSLDTHREQDRNLACIVSRSVSSALPAAGRFAMSGGGMAARKRWRGSTTQRGT